MKHVIFKSGLFRRSNQNTEQGGELSFTKLLKRVLGYFGIPFYDPCCNAPTTFPGGIEESGRAHYIKVWNPTTQVFDNVCYLYMGGIFECVANAGTVINNTTLVGGGIVLGNDAGVVATDLQSLAGMINISAPETVVGPGTLDVARYLSNVESTGVADAMVMGDGANVGLLKKVVHYIDGGSFVLTPTNFGANTTVTFTTVGEYAVFMWNGTDWIVIDLGNTATPGTIPVVA